MTVNADQEKTITKIEEEKSPITPEQAERPIQTNMPAGWRILANLRNSPETTAPKSMMGNASM